MRFKNIIHSSYTGNHPDLLRHFFIRLGMCYVFSDFATLFQDKVLKSVGRFDKRPSFILLHKIK